MQAPTYFTQFTALDLGRRSHWVAQLRNSAPFLLAKQPTHSDVCPFTSAFCGTLFSCLPNVLPLLPAVGSAQRDLRTTRHEASLTAELAAGLTRQREEQETGNVVVVHRNRITKLLCSQTLLTQALNSGQFAASPFFAPLAATLQGNHARDAVPGTHPPQVLFSIGEVGTCSTTGLPCHSYAEGQHLSLATN